MTQFQIGPTHSNCTTRDVDITQREKTRFVFNPDARSATATESVFAAYTCDRGKRGQPKESVLCVPNLFQSDWGSQAKRNVFMLWKLGCETTKLSQRTVNPSSGSSHPLLYSPSGAFHWERAQLKGVTRHNSQRFDLFVPLGPWLLGSTFLHLLSQ